MARKLQVMFVLGAFVLFLAGCTGPDAPPANGTGTAPSTGGAVPSSHTTAP